MQDFVTQNPIARKERLIVKEADGELLVYDLQNDTAHCLNSTAALVWKHCDGRNTVDEIAELVGRQMKTIVDERLVWLALDDLGKFNLLDDEVVKPVNLAGLNRRQLIRNVSLAALALPVILSMAAPTAQAQGSCRPPGAACGSNNQCCTSQCCGSPGVPACPTNNVCV